jgi:tripartite-type tricarboxylate transporter receptor subunit TctC
MEETMRNRFRGICKAAAAALLLGLSTLSAAQDFPSKPLTLVLPFGAGGPSEGDIRRLAAHFEKVWGKPTLVEPRPGAGGMIGYEAVIKAAPDGHTLLWGFATMSAFKVLYKELRFDPLKDVAPISMLLAVPGGLITNTQHPATTVDEFIALVKANPGKYNYASAGRTTQYMVMEAFKAATGANLTEVSFKTQAQIIEALLRNDVQLVQLPLNKTMREQMAAGKMRPLIMTGDRRAPLFPEIPSAGDKGWNIPNNGWQALFTTGGTPGTPRAIIDKISAEVQRFAALPETRATAQETGMDLRASTPEQLRALVEADTKVWASIAKSVGLEPQ